MGDIDTAVFETYHAATGKVLEGEYAKYLVEGILAFRHLFDDVISAPAPVLRDLFSAAPSNKIIFPCDVIELRGILTEGLVSINRSTVPMFAWLAAHRYLRQYPVFILIDANKMTANARKFGGVILYDGEKISIKDAILRIMVNEPVDPGVRDTVRNLVLELNKDIEFSVTNAVPGISPSMPGITASSRGLQKP